MAKVTGPLFSLSASGKFADALVYYMLGDQAVVRELVEPANPQTPAQMEHRSQFGALTKGAKAIVNTVTIEALKAYSNEPWNWRTAVIKYGLEGWNEANAAYSVLTVSEQTNWNTAALALGIQSYELDAYTITAGAIFFNTAYGLSLIGVDEAPDGTNFATWSGHFS